VSEISPDPSEGIVPEGTFVFVTVGTDHHPFDRLVRWTDDWTARTGVACLVQTGTSSSPQRARGTAYLPYPTMAAAMRRAAAVVCHGGPATIMLARQCGRVPIVVPRDPGLGEHVDGHQQKFAAWMAEKGQIVLAQDAVELERRLDSAVADDGALRVATADGGTAAAVARFTELVEALLARKGR
jgi:UDP-N-acetylglucosamine transferase subunit ALG13